jgi:hypothetical protein
MAGHSRGRRRHFHLIDYPFHFHSDHCARGMKTAGHGRGRRGHFHVTPPPPPRSYCTGDENAGGLTLQPTARANGAAVDDPLRPVFIARGVTPAG